MATPTAPRKRTTRPATKRTSAKPTGTFARLRAEAAKGQPAAEPYVIDDVTPPIVIEAPATTEQQIGLSQLFTSEGDFELRDARRILELICGDAFEAVWELLRKEHISVLTQFIAELAEHFGASISEAADFPGGSEASST